MPLPLMVNQTCLIQSLEGAPRVATAQSILRVNESLLSTSLPHIFAIFLYLFCLFVEKLYTEFDGGVPRTTLLGFLPPESRQVTLLEVVGYNVIPPTLLSPN